MYEPVTCANSLGSLMPNECGEAKKQGILELLRQILQHHEYSS